MIEYQRGGTWAILQFKELKSSQFFEVSDPKRSRVTTPTSKIITNSLSLTKQAFNDMSTVRRHLAKKRPFV